jgi:hypothetical protein
MSEGQRGMTPTHEQILRATTALNVAVIEDINGRLAPRDIIKAMRECQNQIAEAIAELATAHRKSGDRT